MKRSNCATMTVGFLLVGLGLASCADTGSHTTPTPSTAQVVAPAKPGQKARAEFPGFRRIVRNEKEYFCQSRSPTGSRARTGEQCFTREELKQMEENNRDFFKDAGGGSSHDSLKMDAPR